MKEKYSIIIDSFEIEDDEIYDAICLFEEYCEEKKIPPISFKAQVEYLFKLNSSSKIKDAVNLTILKSWNSITYAVDNQINTKSNSFVDTSESSFTPKRV